MSPTIKELQDRLELHTRVVAIDEVKPVIPRFGRGIAASVIGNVASVRKGDAETEPTGGFTIAPDMTVLAGDLVFYVEEGTERAILKVLSRNASKPPAGEVFNVMGYGAVGGGTVNDTTAVEKALGAAATAGGGTVVLPVMCGVNRAILIPSNVVMRGTGWQSGLKAIAGSWTGPGYLLANEHYTNLANGVAPADSTVYSDENISVENLCLDFGSLSDGNWHALELRSAQRVRVKNVLFQVRGSGDAVAGRHVDDVIVEGCTAFGFGNCAWDFWCNSSNVVISNNYAESATAVQMINFNPEEGTYAKGLVCTGNTVVYKGATSNANIFGPLGAGTYGQDFIIANNRFVNSVVVVRHDLRRAVVANNIFDGPIDLPAVFSYTGYGGSPVGLVVTGNVVNNPAVAVGNLGVLRVEVTDAIVSNNICYGGNNAVPFIYIGATTPVLMGNASNTDTTLKNRLGKKLHIVSASTAHDDVLITNTGSNGATLGLTGDGAVTPSKWMRAWNGALEFLDHAYSNVIMSMSDAGLFFTRSAIYPGDVAGGGIQTTGGVLHSVGVPNNANGNNNDWCVSDNGKLYFKTAGAWAPVADVATTSVATHEAASDPHVGYRLESADHTHATTGLQGGATLNPTFLEMQGSGSGEGGEVRLKEDYGADSTSLDVYGTTDAAEVFRIHKSGINLLVLRTDGTKTGPSTQAFGDAAVTGTSDEPAWGDHKHAMPVNPVTAHEAAGDPHTGYVIEAPAASQTITAQGAAVIPLIIKGAASQTADLWEAQDSAGTVLVKVDGTGDVYMQKGLPSLNLEAYSAGRPGLALRRSSHATVGLHSAVASGTVLGAYLFQGSDGTTWQTAAFIRGEVDGAVGAGVMPGRMIFLTTPAAGAAVERMRITAAGIVSIGAGAPSGAYGNFEVQGAGYQAAAVRSTDASGVVVALAANAADGARLNVHSNHPLAIYTNSAERMRIDSAGRVGIGMTPFADSNLPLQLNAPASAETYLGLMKAGGYGMIVGFSNGTSLGTGGVIRVVTADPLMFYVNNTTKAMTIDSAGNIGHGTTDALTAALTIERTASGAMGPELLLYNRAASGTEKAALSFAAGDATTTPNRRASIELLLVGSPYDGALSFKTGQGTLAALTERMRIDGAGNVKIAGSAARGTTAGTNHLDIFDGTAPAGTLTNGVSLYSTAGELRVMDAGGTATLLSPHDDDNFWVFDSEDSESGERLHIDVEKLLRFVNDHFGLDYVKGYMARA